MEKLRKLFGDVKMSWGKVIIFAIIAGAFTALMALLGPLKDTSFSDIAVTEECWILFALFIVMNCHKWWEASLKTFVFFLISQPLVYLIQVPFASLGWGIFGYYKYWFVITILTLPGAAIAYLLKDHKGWLGVAILTVANGLLANTAAGDISSCVTDFPHHLIAAIFCIASIIIYCLLFLEGKPQKIVALALAALMLGGFLFYNLRDNSVELTMDTEANWTYEMEDSSYFDIEQTDATHYALKAENDGSTIVKFTSDKGDVVEYLITVSGGQVRADRMS